MFSIPGISTLKTWVIGILTLGLSLVFAWMKTKDAAHAREKLAGEQAARETEQDIAQATLEGLQNEADNKDSRDYDSDRII